MIYTSYFAKLKTLPKNIIPISICGKAPNWYQGLQYKKLAHKYGFFTEWKKIHDNDFYIEHFNDEVLKMLSVPKVLVDLQVLIPDYIKSKMNAPVWVNKDWHIALICYEKPTDLCHRHLVADWLNKNGVECKEWEDNEV